MIIWNLMCMKIFMLLWIISEKHQMFRFIMKSLLLSAKHYNFKEGQDAFSLIEEAKIRNKWVHVGRVNTARKIIYFHGLADSFDGSGIARFTPTRKKALRILKSLEDTIQTRFTDWCE